MLKTLSTASGPLDVLDRGSGDVLLLVHGFPLNHEMWQHQIDEFSRDFRVLAPDLPGFGGSPPRGDTLSMEQMADALRDALEALRIESPTTFCGLSMGGYVAWQFVRKYKAHVKKLILCDTKAAPDTAEAAKDRLKMARHVEDHGTEALSQAMLPKLLGARTTVQRPDLVRQVQASIAAAPPAGVAAAQRGMAERPDARPWLAEIGVPALLIVGEDDVISTPDEMRGIAAAIPGSKLVVIPQAGHMSPLENPAAVNAEWRGFL